MADGKENFTTKILGMKGLPRIATELDTGWQ